MANLMEDVTRRTFLKFMAKLKLSVLLIGIVMLSFGISISRSSGIEKPEPTKDLLALGKKVYSEKCAICHGEKGDGKGEFDDLLYPAPRDFTSGVFKIRSTPTGSLPLDEDLFRTISEGMAGAAMMPFKNDLTERERWAVLYFIKTFSDRWKEEKPEEPIPIGSPPPKTEELLAMGKEVYQRLKCWECHGEKGRGDGPSSDTLKDDAGAPILPYDFTLPGRMRGGHSIREIVKTFLTGMDGTPMPSYHEVGLKEKEPWALAYYVESLAAGRPAPERIGHRIVAQRHKGELPLYPLDASWRKVKPVELPVQRLWTWINGKKTIESIQVRAIYNDRQIALLVEWDDLILNSRLSIEDFSDAIAVQFPLPGSEEGKAFFGMGDHKRPVNIWYWKADSEVAERRDVKRDVFVHPFSIELVRRTSPVEDLIASKPGALTSLPEQLVEGKGIWADGKWHVVFRRTLGTNNPNNNVEFRIGGSYPIAFAVWDGAFDDRDGRKTLTPWQVMEIKKGGKK